MPSVQQLRSRLLNKLLELFQLNQPDLDFGFYRVMHAKAEEVQDFISTDLLKIVADAFGQQSQISTHEEIEKAKQKLVETLGETAIDQSGILQSAFEQTPAAKEYVEAVNNINAQKDNVSAEADVYDHLYRFFERYYDDGDFISRRYYTRETSGKAAPFAIPYNGEEVKLHWANADQYYVKTSEYFANFTFDLLKSASLLDTDDGLLSGQAVDGETRKVHFRIVEATEGEHGNVKASDATKRFFIIHADDPVEFSDDGELICKFEYRPDPEKSGQENTWRDKRNFEAMKTILGSLEAMAAEGEQEQQAADYFRLLSIPAPTERDKDRPLLAKYINQYTARNTMDYFIHKDLGGFLRRELDFYIKNEVMRLDDIENADAPAVESYLAKIKVLRKIAGKLIDFLAQIEDFQKKLWLKKKFVVESQLCLTLDRIFPNEQLTVSDEQLAMNNEQNWLLQQVVSNKAQWAEWQKLGFVQLTMNNEQLTEEAVLEAEDFTITFNGVTEDNDFFAQGPLTYQKLIDDCSLIIAHWNLVLDTRFFDENFKARLVASIENFDEQCDGLLIHSENFQALNLLQERYREQVKCIHIDPPYNTASSGFLYKNEYEHSSWMSLMQDRILQCLSVLDNRGVLSCHIDEYEVERLHILLEQTGLANAGTLIWDKGMPIAGANGLATQHEYVLFRSKGSVPIRVNKKNISLIKQRINDLLRLHHTSSKAAISEYRKWLRSQNQLSKSEKTYDQFDQKGKAFRSDNMSATDKRNNQKFYVPLKHPATGKDCPVPNYGWRYTPESMQKLLSDDLILFGEDHTSMPRKKTYIENTSDSQMASIFTSGQRGKPLLDNLGLKFPFAHAIDFYSHILDACIDQTDLVMDYFGGSGTTAHSIISLNRDDTGKRKYIMVEMGNHFDTVLKPRVAKVVYSDIWKDGKPVPMNNKQSSLNKKKAGSLVTDHCSLFNGVSHCMKYIRLESYEDTLNNLRFDDNPQRKEAVATNPALKEDYMLRYLLDVETRGSQSLLNIDAFADPTAYSLQVKKPGTDEYTTRAVDLIETFNYLIGLRVLHTSVPQTFQATFKRITDPELPEDQHTKLVLDGKMKQIDHCSLSTGHCFWFRKVEGWVPGDPANPNNGQREKVLVVWRKLTGDIEQDNLMLDEWFEKNRINTRDFEFDIIYVNGSNNLPNLKRDDENWKVRLIEEEFTRRMWEGEV